MSDLWKRPASATVSLLALALAGCNPGTPAQQAEGNASMANMADALPPLPAAVPLQPGAATSLAAAPAAEALPPATRHVRVAQVARRGDAYAYLDRAEGVADAIGDAPPDYAYDDGRVSPWVWQTSIGDRRYAEPVDGGYRYYYYARGADTPYLVRDPNYSYAYSGEDLVAVYDAGGDLLPQDATFGRVDVASRYYDRAEYLYRLSRERSHRGVVAANWAARRAEIAAANAQWAEAQARQAEWQAYRQAHASQEQAVWERERAQRAIAAQRFAAWQQRGLRNPPPQPVAYVPPAPQPQRQGWLPGWFGNDPRRAVEAQRRQQQFRAQQLAQQQALQRQMDARRQQQVQAQAQAQARQQQEQQQRANQQAIQRQRAEQRMRQQAVAQQQARQAAAQRQAQQQQARAEAAQRLRQEQQAREQLVQHQQAQQRAQAVQHQQARAQAAQRQQARQQAQAAMREGQQQAERAQAQQREARAQMAQQQQRAQAAARAEEARPRPQPQRPQPPHPTPSGHPRDPHQG